MPARGGDERVWRGGDGARVAGASELGEDRPGSHGVTVRGRRSCLYIGSDGI